MNSPTHPSSSTASGTENGTPDSRMRRLHTSTVWLPALSGFPGFLVMAVVAAFMFGTRFAALSVIVFVLLPAAVYHVIRYATLQYRLTRNELLIRSGLFWKQERRIPLKRFQDIEVRQTLFHRLLKVAKIVIKTAGSDQEEAVLDVVSVEEVQRFKDFYIQSREPESQAVAAPEASLEAGLSAPEKQPLLQLSLNELLLGGVSSRIAGTLGALIAVIIYFWVVLSIGSFFLGGLELPNPLDFFPDWTRFLPLKGTPAEPVLSLFLNDTLGKSVFLILAGFTFSLVKFTIKHHRYRLYRAGDVLTKTEGLFTTSSSSLSSDRVQALKVEETLLRRWFKLAEIWIDSAGDRAQAEDDKKRESFVPVMSREGAFRLVTQIMRKLPAAEPEWRRISRKSILRGSRKGWLVLLAATAQSIPAIGWFSLVWLPGFPLVYLYHKQRFRVTGYWYDEDYLVYRKGWFNRKTLYLPIRNVQNVTLTQNPFDRRHRMGSVTIDTAGQTNTGGGTVIRHLPIGDAVILQRRLARRVASMKFDW